MTEAQDLLKPSSLYSGYSGSMPTLKALIRHSFSKSLESVRNEIALRDPHLLADGRKFVSNLRGWDRQVEECNNYLQMDWSPTVFLHIPKCGGTSVGSLLATEFGEDYLHLKRLSDLVNFTRTTGRLPKAISLVHLSLDFFTTIFGDGVRSSNFNVFTTTRDPYARFVSQFHHLKRSRFIPRRISPEQFLRALQARPIQPDIRSRLISLQLAAPQTSYFGDFTNIRKIPIEDLSGLAQVLPFAKGKALPELNRRPELHPHELSNTEARRVEEIYAEDFAEFGYPIV